MNTIVIARYTECLDWVVNIPPDFRVLIYNKGPKIEAQNVLSKASRVIELQNVGRESETYLCHMLSNVELQGGFTVFSQGDPLTHSPDFINLLERWRDWNAVQPLSWQWRADRNIPPAEVLRGYAQELHGGFQIRPERYSLTTWNPLDFFDAGAYQIGIDYRNAHKVAEGVNLAAHFLLMCGFEKLALKAAAHTVGVFSYGAIFAVRNDLVRTLSKGRALRLYAASVGHHVYGYILERMWLHLFGFDFESPAPLVQKIGAEVVDGEFCFDSPASALIDGRRKSQPFECESQMHGAEGAAGKIAEPAEA